MVLSLFTDTFLSLNELAVKRLTSQSLTSLELELERPKKQLGHNQVLEMRIFQCFPIPVHF